MNTETALLYKLIVLYMLKHTEYPLSNSDISDLVLNLEYTNYFTIQQVISELENSDLISSESSGPNATLYRITSGGEKTLDYFENKISDAIKDDIKSYFKSHDMTFRKDTSISADYYPISGQLYSVRCQVKEKNAIAFELNFRIHGKEQAEAACTNWKKQSDEIYAYLMDMLVQ